MNKSFHNFLMGVSVLPALAILPAMATETITERQLITDSQNFTSVQASVQGVEAGGAMFIQMTNPTSSVNITGNSLFDGNTALPVSGYKCGGAIALDTGVLNIDGANFTNNKATYYGAIYTKGGTMATDNTLTIKNSHFSYNEALGTGAVGLLRKGLIENTIFDHNKATEDEDGAGALFFGAVSEGTVKNSTFEYNEATMRGGAIATRGTIGDNTDAKVDILGSTFSHNTAGTTGGAIDNFLYNNNENEAAVNVVGSTFNSNNAVSGGAIYNHPELDLAGNQSSMKVSDSTFTSNMASENGGAIYNGGTFTLAGTNTFIGNKANGKANDIYNDGTVTVASGTTTMDGGITGTGTLSIAEGATLNVKTAAITQDAIELNGTLIATLRDGDAQITAGTFDGDGTLNLSLAGSGTYHVFGDSVFAPAKDQVTSSVYDLTWTNSDKDLVATIKSVEDIAAENEIAKETAAAIAGMSESTSEKLSDLGAKMQEKLAEGTPEAKQEVEKAAKAVHPEKESVTQSVATSVQTTVNNLAGARMAAPRFGRIGGDIRLTSGGVWAQGLFNKSKQNDAFSGYTRGIAAGMDGTINKVWTIGAGYSYAHSDISGSERDTEIDSNTIFVYGQYKPAAWYLNAVLNYTMSDFREEGIVMGTPVTGDYDVDSFGGSVATGYDFATGITPELGLRYMHVNADDYTNSLGVKTKAKDADFLTGVLGAKYAFNINMDRYTKIIPQLNAAVKYDMLSDRNMATVTMPGVDAYTLRGERLNRLGGEFGIGLGLKYKSVDFSINYDIDVRKDYTSQTGMLKFRYNF